MRGSLGAWAAAGLAFAWGSVAAADAGRAQLAGLRDAAPARRIATCDALTPESVTGPLAARVLARTEAILAGDADPRVRVAAARALGRVGADRSRTRLWAATTADSDPEVADTAALAFGRMARPPQVLQLLHILKTADPRGRTAAARALGATADPRVTEALRFALSADAHWAPRAASALGLAGRAGTALLPVLLGRLRGDRHAAVRAACAEALERITGRALGLDADAWQKAHDAGELRRRPAAPDRGPSRERYADTTGRDHWTVTYWGLTLIPDGTLFCFDVSGSMNYYERLGLARRELNHAVAQMRSGDRFGVLFFNQATDLWQRRFLPANPFTKLALDAYLAEREAKGYTDLLGMFERAFGVGGQGRYAVPAPERLRQLAVLTDGTPSRNFVTDLPLIRRKVREWNPGARVAVHTIGLGSSDEQFLKALADDNRGTFVPKRH